MNEKLKAAKEWLVKHFFDFFMLFMAVTLGLVVDNYRDEQSSRQLAEELTTDLYADICADTAAVNDMMDHCKHKKYRLDSLFKLIDDAGSAARDSQLYRLSAFVNKRPWFERHGSTITMLINSGYLSSLSKRASLAVSAYDIECAKIMDHLRQERQILNEKIFPFQQRIFHTENFEPLVQGIPLETPPMLRDWSDDTRWTYRNYITELQSMNDAIAAHYQHLQTKADSTLRILHQEYHADAD